MAETEYLDSNAAIPGPVWTQEQGETGLRGATPREGWLHQEFLTALRGRRGMKMYAEMANNDPLIGAVLQAHEMMIKSMQWYWTPSEESNEARAMKEIFEDLFNRRMVTTFGDVIEEALQMLVYGFMPMEIVMRRMQLDEGESVIGVHKLAPRSPDTLWRWRFDRSGDVIAMDQNLQYGNVVTIPMAKLVNFRTVSKLGSPEGRSILRNAYTSYVKKQIVEDSEGKSASRAAGLVVLRIPQRFLDPNAPPEDRRIRQAYENMGKAVARDRQAYLLLSSKTDPSGKFEYDIEYKTASTTNSTDYSPIIDRHDRRMAMSMLADFLMLGHEKIGSFALSQNKTDFFSTAVGAVGDNIAEPINRGLVPKIMELNGWDARLTPKLEHSDLRMQDPEVMTNIATTLAGAGFENVMTPEVSAAIMKAAKLPVAQQMSDVG